MSDERSCIAFYRLGVRLGQALTICDAVGSDPERDDPILNAAITRLRVAWEALVQILGRAPLTRRGDDALDRMERLMRSTSEYSPELIMPQYLNELTCLVREQAKLRRADKRSEMAWFDLGLEIVRVDEVTGHPVPSLHTLTAEPEATGRKRGRRHRASPAPEKRFEWSDRARLDSLLEAAGLSLDDVFKVQQPPEPADEIKWIYAMSYQRIPWCYIEMRLEQLELDSLPVVSKESDGAGGAKEEPRKKPALLRNLMFLSWYEQKGSDTYRSPAAIRDKWNSDRTRKKVNTTDVVDKGLAAARAHLKATGFTIDVAIARLEETEGKEIS